MIDDNRLLPLSAPRAELDRPLRDRVVYLVLEHVELSRPEPARAGPNRPVPTPFFEFNERFTPCGGWLAQRV